MDIFKNGIIRFYVMQTSKTCCARVLSEWREFFGDAVFPNQRKEESRQGKQSMTESKIQEAQDNKKGRKSVRM